MDISPRSTIREIKMPAAQPAPRTPSSNYPSSNYPSSASGSPSSQASAQRPMQAVAYADTLAGPSPTPVHSIQSRTSARHSPGAPFNRAEPRSNPTRNRNWTLYALSIGGAVAVGLALGFGLGFGLRKHAGPTAGASVGKPSVSLSPVSPITSAATSTMSATAATAPTTTSLPATATPTLASLQDPSFEPQPADADLGQQVGSWQAWDVSLFPAGLPTVGDVSSEEIPNSEAAQTFQSLALNHPDYVRTLVRLRPGDTFQMSMTDPQGNPVSVQVDNKFLTASDGSLLQVGSAGHLPTWATVMEKGVAKLASVLKPSNERSAFYGLSNVTADDVLRAFVPGATRDDKGNVVIPGVAQLDPKVATRSALTALSNTFSGLPTDGTRQAAFNRAVNAALSGDGETLKGAIADLSASLADCGLKEVAAYDNIISGLTGVLAWVQKA